MQINAGVVRVGKEEHWEGVRSVIGMLRQLKSTQKVVINIRINIFFLPSYNSNASCWWLHIHFRCKRFQNFCVANWRRKLQTNQPTERPSNTTSIRIQAKLYPPISVDYQTWDLRSFVPRELLWAAVLPASNNPFIINLIFDLVKTQGFFFFRNSREKYSKTFQSKLNRRVASFGTVEE